MMLMTHREQQHERCARMQAPLPAATEAAPAPTPAPAPVTAKSTKRHWRALRNALLAKPVVADGNTTASSISTEFFPVFAAQLSALGAANGAAEDSLQRHHRRPEPNFEWMQYDVSFEKTPRDAAGSGAKIVYVHEKQKNKGVSLQELFSHKVNQGVDNTGNVRTWPSEQVMLTYLLKQNVCENLAQRSKDGETAIPLNCCELGGGMAGLASLGLLAHAPVPFGRFDITDGNPLSVKNLKICVGENIAQGAFAKSALTQINVDLLRWDRNVTFSTYVQHQFDLLLASDCLFFEDFHYDLAHTIKQLLRPRTGRCYMLQPSRNGSMERFSRIAETHGLHVECVSDYDAEITAKHEAYLRTRPDYAADVHYPVLLIVSAPAPSVTPSSDATRHVSHQQSS
uniref:Calmodulin-lysine N-methyltransferase n=1 Tax=Globisporangium ultimum (strain ATCC 200006 / CBS 805.95 / DAOM BR144) TaxID=431595 RepID=K3WTP5_GLOUD